MNKINVGFCRVTINPPLGIHQVGRPRERFIKKILDDITVSAVAFDDGVKKAVVMSVDHLSIFTREADAFRKQIAEHCGLPLEAIFMHSTHTHSGSCHWPQRRAVLSGNPRL